MAQSPISGMHVPIFVAQVSQRTLARLGVTHDIWAEHVLAATGVDPRDELSQNALVEMSKFVELLRRTIGAVGAGRLLRWYVEDARLAQLGPIGVAALTAPTVGDSLDVMLRHLHALAPVLTATRRDTRQDIILSWQLNAPLDGIDTFFTELALLNLKQQFEYLGREPGAITVRFAHAPVASDDFYRRNFGASVCFGQCSPGEAANTMVIPRELLARSNDAYVPMLWKQATAAAEVLMTRVRSASQVAPRVREVLAEGAARGLSQSLEDVASRLGVSTRTLARRLGEEGTSFRDILGHSRIEHAMRQLRHTSLPIKAIGANAGFSNFSAFSRAFRKLTELSPSEYREAV